MSSIFVVVVLVAFIAWLFAPAGRRRATGETEPVDEDELSAAEREVRDLDVHQRPEDGFQGDDWGPGAGSRQ
jgi:hypothetical protein